MRRLLPCLLVAAPLMGESLAGQNWSLASRLSTPSLYLAVDTKFARRLRDVLPDSAIARVLRDSGCAVPEHELILLSRVSELCLGTMEVALGGDDAAVVVHCELPEEAARKVQTLIDNDAVVEVVEKVSEGAGVPIVALRESRRPRADQGNGSNERQSSFALYLALAQGHLVVASAPTTVRRLLNGDQAARTLADDVDFRELSKRVEGERAELTVFGAWREIANSIARLLPAEQVGPWLVAASAMDARSLLIAVRGTANGFASSLLLHPTDAPAVERWLTCVERVPLASLLADLPRAGLANLTLAFNADAVRKSEAGSHLASLYGAVAGGCAEVGLNVEQQILQRLKGVVGVQMVALPSPTSATRRLSSAYVAKAKSERDAQRLVGDCRRVVLERGRGRVEVSQTGEELVLPPNPTLNFAAPRLTSVRDSIVVATERGVAEQVVLNERADGKGTRWVAQAIKNLAGAGQRPVAGVVFLDLSSALPTELRERAALRQHAGYLRIQPDHIRLELFSQL